jgi:hypothetical protein
LVTAPFEHLEQFMYHNAPIGDFLEDPVGGFFHA